MMNLFYKCVVQPWMCDMMGHLTTREYMALFDEATYQMLAETTGWSMNGAEWLGKGWADVKHEIEYKGELKSGSFVEISGGITKVGRSSLESFYELKNKMTGEVAATMIAKTVFFDLDARCSIPLTEKMKDGINKFSIA